MEDLCEHCGMYEMMSERQEAGARPSSGSKMFHSFPEATLRNWRRLQ